MAVRRKYRQPAPAVPSFQFIDIVSGTGYILMYGGTTHNSSTQYRLSNITFDSKVVSTAADENAGNLLLAADLDFDVKVNRPITLRGIGIVNVQVEWNSGTNTGECYIVARLRKVSIDGGTETELFNTQSQTVTDDTRLAVDMDITRTAFKIGETIRLTIEVWIKSDAVALSAWTVQHDPTNRVNNPDTLLFQMPVRIEL